MNFPLAIVGQGAVSAAGLGVDALLGGKTAPLPTAAVGRAEPLWPVLRVDANAEAFQRWQREPRLRRASPLTLFMTEAASQALAGATEAERAETGLVVALSTGALIYTRRFFDGILAQGRKMASPALFPETVFNSPGSHVAATLKLSGAASVLLGDETAWIAAMQTAAVWLKQRRVRQVLVLGAEEFDPVALDVYRRARWLGRPFAFTPGEGAAALLLRAAKPDDRAVITEARDGYIYRNACEARAAAEKLFGTIDPKLPCARTAAHTWLGALEEKMTTARPAAKLDAAPYPGEAFTASAGWNTMRALRALSPEQPALALPVWGLNQQLGALTLVRGEDA
jgi:hypothetical protein